LKLKAERKDVGEAGPVKEKGKANDNSAPMSVAAAEGTSKADAAQLKPGAGKEKGEDVPNGPTSGKKTTFSFWRGKRKGVDRGKFVEDVNSGSGSGTPSGSE